MADETSGAAAVTGDAADYAPGPADGWLTRKLHGFYVWRRNIRAHPLIGTLFAVALATAGFLAAQAFEWVKDEFSDPDEFLVQMSEKQDQEFAALRAGLDALREGDASAERQVESAIEAIEASNQGLLAHLSMARQEYERLRQITAERTGLDAGYDFVLTEQAGLRIDAGTVLGVNYVNRNGAGVSLTSLGRQESTEFLKSGESVDYQGVDGQACKLALLSIDEARGAASFARICGMDGNAVAASAATARTAG